MTIFATPFTDDNKTCTGKSSDSGFASLDEVVACMGPDYVSWSYKYLIYGEGNDRVIFSPIPFCIDDAGNSA